MQLNDLPTLDDHVRSASKVLIVSGSYGAGHDMAAKEIRLRLEARGCDVEVVDVVDMFPIGLGKLSRSAYLAQIQYLPRTWEILLAALDKRQSRGIALAMMVRLARRALLLRARGCDVVISTHPFPAQALGPARRSGLLSAKLLTYLTDMSVHSMWVHPDVDLHLALHPVAADQARGFGGRTVVIAPLLPQLPSSTRELVSLGPALQLPSPYALVCGGSLGIGKLAATARDLSETGLLTPVVLCGSNRRLYNRLKQRDGMVALAWRDDVTALMTGAALVIANSGGFMTKEALAVGTPLISYRCLPGHGVANACAIEQAGHGEYARNRAQFRRLVREVSAKQLPTDGRA